MGLHPCSPADRGKQGVGSGLCAVRRADSTRLLTLDPSDQYVHRCPVTADGRAELALLLSLHGCVQLGGGLLQVAGSPSFRARRQQRKQFFVVSGGIGSF